MQESEFHVVAGALSAMLLPCVEDDVRAVAAEAPPMWRYGLSPGQNGYRLVELRDRKSVV